MLCHFVKIIVYYPSPFMSTSPPPRPPIVAIATPPGRGAIGLVRLSGRGVFEVARGLVGALPAPRVAGLRRFRAADGGVLDQGLVICFAGPCSATGEDMVELHAHGGPVLLRALLERCCALGARLALPGEFSERAFLNGRMDLAQAEAVADLIDGATEAAVRAAANTLTGAFSERIRALADELTELRVHAEVVLDFPDEATEHDENPMAGRLRHLAEGVRTLLGEAQRGQLLRDGFSVVLVGLPNAGKSSLFNHLCAAPRAIVHAEPGTTRDTLEQRIEIDGLPLHLTDTAGLRDAPGSVEAEGVRRAEDAARQADLQLLVVDDAAGDAGAPPLPNADGAGLIVYNKIDLTGRAAGKLAGGGGVAVSVKTGAGLEDLLTMLVEAAGLEPEAGAQFIARERHLQALRETGAALESGLGHLDEGADELLAEALVRAQTALGEMTGQVDNEALLGEIFRKFCIGK